MRPAWLFAASALLASATQAAPLTFDAALRLAEQDAPSLAAKALDVAAARSSAVAAGRLPDPKLRLGLDNFPVSGPPAWRFGPESMTMATLGVMQDVPNAGKRRSARDRAAADIGAAEASGRLETRDVRLGAALAWIDLHYAERRLAALDEVDRALAPLRGAAPAQLVSGAVRPAQALEAEQLTAVLGDRRAELISAAAKARSELARWTGDAFAEVIGAPPSYDLAPARLRAGLDGLPTLTAYDALTHQADADLAAARAEKHPDWSWDLTYQRRDPMWGDMVSLGATVSLPVFAGKRQDPLIVARAASASRVRLEREAARRQVRSALDTDLADLTRLRDRLARADTLLVPLAKRRADLDTASYAAGSAGLGDVLQAFLALADTHIDRLDREAELTREAARIALTYGTDAP
ncbi:TolC family protein [Phenylobacterium aquaticum]|uniref:TolC family protein n=1 Tax=Phenylobacterium aquaticum TaxID=1763816 RepID=UPI001F5CDAAE|nr:TolC family protein [Phenylobacterium aquaticum]MCI3132799.1 TolC family protein [Phenylobacterium aquaticum]